MRKLGALGVVIFALIPACALVAPAGASAALSGSPIQLGSAQSDGISEVVGPDGQDYIAWLAGTGGPAGGTQNIDWCVIDPGQTSCSQSGTLSPVGTPTIDQPLLTIVGSDVVLVSQDFDGGSNPDNNYVNEWTASDTATSVSWTAVDSGESVALGNEYVPNAIFPIPNGASTPTALGYGFGQVGDNNGIENVNLISPFTAPPVCSQTTQGTNSGNCPSTPLAALNTPTEDFVTQDQTSFGSDPSGSDAGVLAMTPSPYTACPAGTPANGGVSFAYAAGANTSTNNYGVSAGTSDSAWHGMSNFQCDDFDPAVAGGASGFGVLAQNGSLNAMQYTPFNINTGTFGTTTTIASENGSGNALSQDGTGDLYATWVDGNSVYPGALRLAYSANTATATAGSSWTVATLNDESYPLLDPTSAVGSDGQGWAIWLKGLGGGSYGVEAQQFDAADATPVPTTLTTSQTSGSQTGADISVASGTTGEDDQATLTGANASIATGSVTYDLYSSSTCSSASLVFDAGSSSVTNGVVGASEAEDSALPAGTYYWQASYGGDIWNAPSVSACGSEVLTVEPPVTTTTTTTPTPTPTPPGTGVGSGGGTVSSSGTTVLVSFSCTAACSGTISIVVDTTTGAIVLSDTKAKTKVTTLGTTAFRLTKKGSVKLTIKLTKAGRLLVKRDHDRLRAYAVVKLKGVTKLRVYKLKLKPAPKPKKKK